MMNRTLASALIPFVLIVAGCGGGGGDGGGGGSSSGGGGGGGGGSGQGSGSFTAVASMSHARANPSSALLPDGKVLVAGGTDSAGHVLASTEIFDPSTGQWTSGPNMSNGYANNRGFLLPLPNGQVLALESSVAEVYDPGTNQWMPAASPPTLVSEPFLDLPDGRVFTQGDSVGAYLYSPKADEWTAYGGSDVRNGRTYDAAAVLKDGRVLISGGALSSSSDRTATSLLFDPAKGTWTSGPNMSLARDLHFAVTLADGRVVVSHGIVQSSTVDGTTEVYDPTGNSWSVVGNVLKFEPSTLGATCTVLKDGTILVAGGSDNSGVILDQTSVNVTNAEIFDPSTLKWHHATPAGQGLLQPRSGHTAVRLADGRVLIAGGTYGGALSSAEVYQP